MIAHQHRASRRAGAEIGKGFEPRRNHIEQCSRQLANYRLAKELLPPGLGLAVVHQEVGIAQAPGGAEI